MASLGTIEMRASSKTLNKSISELDSILDDGLPTTSQKLRKKYHDKLRDVIEEIALGWYETGFKRAHKTMLQDGDTKQRKLEKRMRIRAPYFRNGMIRITLKSKR